MGREEGKLKKEKSSHFSILNCIKLVINDCIK